jgi:hypothetical protein
LIISKVAVAVIASKFLPVLEGRGYVITMKILAATMVGFGVLSVVRAVELGQAVPYD